MSKRELGITEDDRRNLQHILDARESHATEVTPDYDRPPLPIVDGERQVVELRGKQQTTVHRPDPDSDGPEAWCSGKFHGFDPDSTERSLRFRRLRVAREWREPCSCCFPEGFPDE